MSDKEPKYIVYVWSEWKETIYRKQTSILLELYYRDYRQVAQIELEPKEKILDVFRDWVPENCNSEYIIRKAYDAWRIPHLIIYRKSTKGVK